jgi:hypothetical protein
MGQPVTEQAACRAAETKSKQSEPESKSARYRRFLAWPHYNPMEAAMTKALKRRTVAAAFRRMANGVEAKAAYANTLGFWVGNNALQIRT